jgi:RND family efflux transporter MFP subunit
MHPESLRRLVRSLRESAGPDGGGVGDAELLERFARGRDEAAFELLLYRHGPMVLAVCRRLLREPHDVEDAFQATFLALVRKAGSVRRGDAVGAWLHRVACRVALRLRGEQARRAGREQAGVQQVAAAAARDWGAADDLRGVLDEEVNRLPARQRAAFVLCCLEGKTGREAARQLGCSPGTVSSRLTRAREVLRRRLTRRGLAPAAVSLTALAGDTPAAVVPAILVPATLKVSMSFAAGTALPGRAASLAEGVLRTMFLSKMRTGALVVLLVLALTVGGLATRHALTAAPPGDGAGPQAREAEKNEKSEKKPAAVTVVRPQSERVAWRPCTVLASEVARLTAPVPGVLKEVSVDLGDRVTRGQLLAVIDAPLLALEARQAAAIVQQTRAAVEEAEARLVGVKAQVEGAVAPRSSLLQAQAGVAVAKANLEAAQVGLEKAQYRLSLTRITSPVEGVVTHRDCSPGQSVRSGEQGGDSMLTVQRTNRMRVQTSVYHGDVPFTQPGAPVDLAFGPLPDDHYTGYKISRIGFVEDADQMSVEIDVPNPRVSLRPGMGGEVAIHLDKAPPGELRIPESCLISSPGRPENEVYVVRAGKAHRTAVMTGGFHFSEAVIVSGLHADDQVIADPKGLSGDVVPVEVKKGATK